MGLLESGEEDNTEVIDKDKRKIYPSGRPLRLEERELPRKFRTKSTSTGDYLCWDFSSHAGCPENGGACPKGNRDTMSPNGLCYSMRMQMARRGGRKSFRRIKPEEVDGYIQALRDNAVAEEKVQKQPPTQKEYPMWPPKKKAGGSDPSGINESLTAIDKIPEWMAHR